MNVKRLKLLLCLLCVLLIATTLHAQQSFRKLTRQATQLFEQDLTGYGHIKVWENQKFQTGSKVWVIQCINNEKASLLHAKYISDIQLNPSEGKLVKQGKFVYFEAASGICTGAVRISQWVVLFSLRKSTQLKNFAQKLATDSNGSIDQFHWKSSTTIPMYLDRFDKHGFRFYYRPWEVPNKSQVHTYNPITEFDYAKDKGDLGFVFWNPLNEITTGEGFFNRSWWSWGMEAATQRKLPVQINSSMSYHAPVWLANKYPQWITRKMPSYVGGIHRIASPYLGGQGIVQMGDNPLRREALSVTAKEIHEFNPLPNVTSWLEPYGEVFHGKQNIFLDYGPQVDLGYQKWLKNKYETLPKLNERWYGNDQKLSHWDDVRFPELATFLGYDSNALDLMGTWKIAHVDQGKSCPANWYQSQFDDTEWGTLTVPGDDHMMFLPKTPAVYRRTFDMPEHMTKSSKKKWIYIWDLTDKQYQTITIHLNDKLVSTSESKHAFPHWVAVDVTEHLKSKNNFLAVGLPRGFMAYRAYISEHTPVIYPNLGQFKNAQWVDFADFAASRRVENIRIGLQMLRQIDPTRPITMMAPDYVADTLKDLASQYNGNFHNTGYMSAFWADYLPMLMRSVDRPFTLEPGGPASTAQGMGKMIGCWLTEGINGVDYFIHIGSILWNQAIKKKFETYLPALKTMGSYHQPKAQIAQLISARNDRLTNFPWPASDMNLPSGYWRWNLSRYISHEYSIDAINENDFGNGVAKDYAMVVDTNTSILSNQKIQDIENWVRKGGIFVTFVETGRHLPEKRNAWPISQLTGYEVLSHDSLTDVLANKVRRKVMLAVDVKDYTLPHSLNSAAGFGLRLKATDADCQDLLLWDDGTVAVGRRKMGKGYVIHVGCRFSPDRLWFGNPTASVETITSLFDLHGMKKLPGSAKGVRFRHYVSNNGLYDVWALWNESKSKTMTKLDIFEHTPAVAYEVITGKTHSLLPKKHGARLANLVLQPNESRLYFTQRNQQVDAPADWLDLQRKWWKKSTGDLGEKFETPRYPNTLHLSEGWQPTEPNTVWPDRLQIRPNNVSQSLESSKTFTRSFTIPQSWQGGQILFWIHSWVGRTFLGKGRVELDGKVIKDWSHRGIDGMDLTSQVTPGSTHQLTVKIRSNEPLIGMRGETWLHYIPDPVAKIDLAGDWQMSDDVLHFDRTVKLPGHWAGYMAKREINIPKKLQNKQAFLRMQNNGMIFGAIVNGHWLRSHHHGVGQQFDINITPWVHFGQSNKITLVNWNGVGHCEVDGVQLYFQNKTN